MTILILDPGESTGYLVVEIFEQLTMSDKPFYSIVEGGTIPKDHTKVWEILNKRNYGIIIYETFNMYPGKAKALSWNSFYPCEVIGIIKLWYMLHQEAAHLELVGLAPSTKKYAGGFDNLIWKDFRSSHDYTEHTKDTWLLFQYWYRNKRK